MKDRILSHLPPDFPWGESLYYYPVIDSTNTHLKALCKNGSPHGTCVIAGSQTAGRGRLGRQFYSPEGMGVYLSLLLRPFCPAEELMHLTCAAGVAMCRAVEACAGICPQLKWPNDLVYQSKKLGGILTELTFDCHGNVDGVILGVGINCCGTPEDFPPELREIATSLSCCVAKPVSADALAAAMVAALWELEGQLFTQKEALMTQYRSQCITLGKEVSLLREGKTLTAVAVDVDAQGSLQIRLPNGQIQTVSSGEVSVRGLYGYL